MLFTQLILVLLCGLIIAERNTRKIGFGDNRPWLEVQNSQEKGHYIDLRFMDNSYKLDFDIYYSAMDKILAQISSLS